MLCRQMRCFRRLLEIMQAELPKQLAPTRKILAPCRRFIEACSVVDTPLEKRGDANQ